MKKGLFISFEGGDACGKSTQVNMVKKFFEENFDKDEYIFIREPGGTPLAEKIRDLILNYTEDKPLPMTELLLFCAARSQITQNVIIPALHSGKIVIADRFYDSTIAYQGEARGIMSKNDIISLTRTIIGDLKPDLTFYLKISAEEAFKRKKPNETLDNIESAGIEFHKAVERGYNFIADVEKERFCVVDATKTPEQIFNTIKEKILQKINEIYKKTR